MKQGTKENRGKKNKSELADDRLRFQERMNSAISGAILGKLGELHLSRAPIPLSNLAYD